MRKNLRNSGFKIHNSNFRLQSAFTTMEMMIIVSIILLFTGLVVVNYRGNQSGILLQSSATKLGQNLKKARDLAMFSREFGGQIPAGGYGINLRAGQNSYVLFADCNKNYVYNDLAVCGQPPTLSEKFEEFKLESGVVFLKISPGSPQNIVFTPPNPTVVFSPTGSVVEITLALVNDSSKRKTIFVNPLGLIKIK